MPNPLAWLRANGFPHIPEGKEGWEWLATHWDDLDVQEALARMPKGLLND